MSETISNSAYVYDPTVATQSYGAAAAINTYPTVSSTSFTYWNDGSVNSDGAYSYQYDEKKNLKAVFAAGSSTNYEANRNDALGERFWAERNPATGTPTASLLLTDGLAPEVAAEQLYSKSGSSFTATGWRDYVLGSAPDERLIYLDESGVVRYPHTDKRGSAIALAYTGTAQSKFKYGPFGETSDSPSGYAWRYTGQHVDAWTGLYWYKAREYAPTLGRFLQADPAGFVDGPNEYSYVGNDPVDKTDPLGLQELQSLSEDQSYWNYSLSQCHGNMQCAQRMQQNFYTQRADQVSTGIMAVEGGLAVRGGWAALRFSGTLVLRYGVKAVFREFVARVGAAEIRAIMAKGGLRRATYGAADGVQKVLMKSGKAKDFAGAVRELNGELAGTGHIVEMRQSVVNLEHALESFKGSLNNPTLSGEARRDLEKLYGITEKNLEHMKAALSGH